MTQRWAHALYEAAFGVQPEASWRTESVRMEGALSFYLKLDEMYVHGLLRVTGEDETQQTVEALRAFWRMQHYVATLCPGLRVVVEQHAAPMPLLQGDRGVVLCRGSGSWLALCDEGAELRALPWLSGDPLLLEVSLRAPALAGVVVVFPSEAAEGFEAELVGAAGRRRGRVWSSQQRLWFAVEPVGLWPPLEPAVEGDAELWAARMATVQLQLVRVYLAPSKGAWPSFVLELVVSEGSGEASRDWMLARSSDRLGLWTGAGALSG